MRNLVLGSAFSMLLALVAGCGSSTATQARAPVANAGPDQSVATGSVVTLDGSHSLDPDGQPITYQWAFVAMPAGSQAELSDPTSPKPTFTADLPGSYELELVVSNGKLTGDPSDVLVTATTSNGPPTADAGRDQSVAVDSVVHVDGSGSSDPDGDPLTYLWSFVSKPDASQAGIEDPTSATTLFVTDVAGEYVVQLLVSDGVSTSAPSQVTVTASVQNVAPVANAGPDQTVATGAVVTIDGAGSTDADGDPITFQWTFVSRPDGSNAGIQDPTAANTLFVADVGGQYVLRLVVSDGQTASAPDTLVVTAGGAIVPSMTGTWTGSTSAAGITASIELALEEAPDGTISGNANLDLGPLGPETGPVTGTHSHPDVTLVAGTAPLQASYAGTFTGDDTVEGTVTVNALPVPLTLHRQ